MILSKCVSTCLKYVLILKIAYIVGTFFIHETTCEKTLNYPRPVYSNRL